MSRNRFLDEFAEAIGWLLFLLEFDLIVARICGRVWSDFWWVFERRCFFRSGFFEENGGQWQYGMRESVYVFDDGMQCVLVFFKLQTSLPPALRVRHPPSDEWIQGRGSRRLAAQGARESTQQRFVSLFFRRKRHVQAYRMVKWLNQHSFPRLWWANSVKDCWLTHKSHKRSYQRLHNRHARLSSEQSFNIWSAHTVLSVHFATTWLVFFKLLSFLESILMASMYIWSFRPLPGGIVAVLQTPIWEVSYQKDENQI